jgi:hypothetical protein
VDIQAQLFAIITALAGFIATGLTAVVKYLVAEINRRDTECNTKITKLESRIDEGASAVARLNDVLEKQVAAHEATIATLTGRKDRP